MGKNCAKNLVASCHEFFGLIGLEGVAEGEGEAGEGGGAGTEEGGAEVHCEVEGGIEAAVLGADACLPAGEHGEVGFAVVFVWHMLDCRAGVESEVGHQCCLLYRDSIREAYGGVERIVEVVVGDERVCRAGGLERLSGYAGVA